MVMFEAANPFAHSSHISLRKIIVVSTSVVAGTASLLVEDIVLDNSGLEFGGPVALVASGHLEC